MLWHCLGLNLIFYNKKTHSKTKHCVSNVKHEHLVQQEEIGLIRKCDKHLIKRFGKAMHTYEPATADRGHRLRPLLHPSDVNEWADFDGEMSLESTAEQMYGIDRIQRRLHMTSLLVSGKVD